MRRRDFITLLGSAAAAWPLVARAQQAALPVIGTLSYGSPTSTAADLTVFREGLSEVGYTEGRNVVIENSWAYGQYDRFPELAAELVRRGVNLIFVVGGGGLATKAAQAATSTIPIVFTGGFDPIEQGVVKSLARPGSNVTGATFFANELEAKRLGLLRLLVPHARVIAILRNPINSSAEGQSRDLAEAARTSSVELHFVDASDARDFAPAFASMVQRGVDGLVVTTDGFFSQRRDDLIALAARHAIPAIFYTSDYAKAGGLMSYAARNEDAYRQAGIYAGRILKGEKPGDLPVQLPTRFEVLINLKTAKAIGLTVPGDILSIADEIIE
jgi:putative tryptophan/tyrosine transport system substrate-binding protein